MTSTLSRRALPGPVVPLRFNSIPTTSLRRRKSTQNMQVSLSGQSGLLSGGHYPTQRLTHHFSYVISIYRRKSLADTGAAGGPVRAGDRDWHAQLLPDSRRGEWRGLGERGRASIWLCTGACVSRLGPVF